MTISYSLDLIPEPKEVAELLIEGGFLRPLEDLQRVQRMLDHGNITVTVRNNNRLVGFCRAISDGSYYCLVAEVVVAIESKGQGIGKRMLDLVQQEAGEEVNLVLTSSEEGEPFYEHLDGSVWKGPLDLKEGANASRSERRRILLIHYRHVLQLQELIQ